MCLDIVNKRYLFPRSKEFVAYKQFILNGRDLQTPVEHVFMPVGQWLEARGFRDRHGWFRTGFYCYKFADQARLLGNHPLYPIIAVRVRGLVTEGSQDHGIPGYMKSIVIVRELFIPTDWHNLGVAR